MRKRDLYLGGDLPALMKRLLVDVREKKEAADAERAAVEAEIMQERETAAIKAEAERKMRLRGVKVPDDDALEPEPEPEASQEPEPELEPEPEPEPELDEDGFLVIGASGREALVRAAAIAYNRLERICCTRYGASLMVRGRCGRHTLWSSRESSWSSRRG